MKLSGKRIRFQYPETGMAVFRDLNFEIDGPGFHALFGPSGVGKTTLARMIIGGINRFSGTLSTHGMQNILYTYNMERLPGWSSVREHLELNTPASRTRTLEDLVDSFGLQTCMNKRFSQLSLGQQNRTNLARYLLQDFELLIMDESLANVDEMTKESIIQKIKAEFADRCFIYISHNVVEVAKFCRHIMILRGSHRQPQALVVDGLDHSRGRPTQKLELERTMLEIVHAA
jgi:ABC-type nitrate/sulfonate/bicarbonate transport system ATPase subunit